MTTAIRHGAGSFLICLTAVVMPAAAQQPEKEPGKPGPPRVVATASATAYVPPDAARLTFVVTATEEPGKSAREANDKQVKKVKDAIAALSLGMATVDVHVLPSTGSNLVSPPANATTAPAVQARRATSSFQVTVRERDFDKLREAVARVAEAASDNGGEAAEGTDVRHSYRLPRNIALGIGGGEEEPETVKGPSIEWLATDAGDARREAIRRAVKDARADAEAAAGTNKLTVVEIDVSGGDGYPGRRGLEHVLEGNGTPQAGLVHIRVEVRLTCTY